MNYLICAIQHICGKPLDPCNMKELREEVAMTLCILEKEFHTFYSPLASWASPYF